MAETERDKIIKASTEVIKRITETKPTASPEKSQTNILEEKKIEARRKVNELEKDPEHTKAQIQKTKKEPPNTKEAQAALSRHMGSADGGELSWLAKSATEFQNEEVLDTVSRIAEAPPELRNDAHFLLAEGTRLHWLTADTDLTTEARGEVNTVLHRIYAQIEETKQQTPDFSVEDATVKDRVLGEQPKKRETQPSGHNRTANRTGDELFEDVLNAAELHPHDRQRLQEMCDVLNAAGNDPESAVSIELIRSYVGQTENMLRRAATPEGEVRIAEISARLRQRLTSFYDNDRIPSTIMLTRDEVHKLITDPLGFFEQMSQDIALIASERGFDSPILEQRINRYRLMTDYFVSDSYNKERGIQLAPDVSATEREAFHEKHRRLLETKGKVLDQYTDRLHALEFSYYIQQVGDFEKDPKFLGLLDKINERGAYNSRAQYGGLAEVALQKMRSIHDALLRDPKTAEKYRSLPEIMKEVRARTAEAMYQEKAIWAPQLEQYIQRMVGEQSDVIPRTELKYDKQTCKTITAVAEASYQMFFEKVQIMSRGIDPALGEKLQKINSYETADAEEKILGTFRFRDWFLRKWNGALSGQKALWNLRSLWYVHKDPALREWASARTDSLFQELQQKAAGWKQNYELGNTDSIKRDPLYTKLQTIFSEYEEKAELAEGKDILFFSRLNRNKLYRQVACDVGGEMAQLQGARCYGYWESGPRRAVVTEMIQKHPLLQKYFSVDKDHFMDRSLAVGLDLFESSRGWFFPDRKRTDAAELKFLKSGDRALQYQPHLFYKTKHMREQIPLGDQQAQLLEEVTQRFDAVQSRLMLSGEGSINYAKSQTEWSEGQRRTLRSIFETVRLQNNDAPFVLTEEQYVSQMKKYYESFDEVTRHDGYKTRFTEFAHIKYAPDFSFVLFTNDIPLAVLQNRHVLDINHIGVVYGSAMAEAVKQYHSENVFISVSEHSTDKEQGKGGLWRRAWSDFGTASSTIPLQNDLLDADEKIFSTAVKEMRNKVKQYQGPAEGTKSALEAIVGYLEAAKVKPGYTEFLKGMKNSSIMKEYWGDLSKSLAIDELSEEYDKFEKLLGKLGKEAPGAEEWAKDYLNITGWRKMLGGDEGFLSKLLGEERFDKIVERLNENFPNKLYGYKIRNVAIFGVLVFLLFALDQAKKGGEETKQK